MTRAADHVEAFNHAVTTGDWPTFAARFAEDARMSFPDLPIGPYYGRAAIAQAYRDNPPTETMTILAAPDSFVLDLSGTGLSGTGLSGTDDEIRFQWSSGPTGTMHITWTPTAQIATLTISFD
jgi:hypothetical protein